MGADFASHVPDCLPTATFYPRAEAEALRVRGVGARSAGLQGPPAGGDFDPAIHCSTGMGFARGCRRARPHPLRVSATRGRFTGPGPIGEVLDRFPRLRVIVAHLGADGVRSVLDMVQARENTWLDTTMALTDFMQQLRPFPVGRLAQLRALSRQGKVLFGSDFPNIPYPYAHQVEVLSDHGLDMPEVLWRAPVRAVRVVRLLGYCSSRGGGVLGAQRAGSRPKIRRGGLWQVQPGV